MKSDSDKIGIPNDLAVAFLEEVEFTSLLMRKLVFLETEQEPQFVP